MRRMRWVLSGVLSGVVLAVSACGGGGGSSSPSGWTPPTDAVEVPLPLSQWTPSSASSSTQSVQGTLEKDGLCIRLREAGTGKELTPIWPAGSTGYQVGDEIIVVNDRSVPVARTGETVDYSGGLLPPPFPDQCTQATAGSTFVIQEDIGN